MMRRPVGGSLLFWNNKFSLTGCWFCGLDGDDERRARGPGLGVRGCRVGRTLSLRNDKVPVLVAPE